MRKVGLIIAVLLCINETVCGQWIQLPFPTTDNLRSVAFVNADTGFVVATNKVYRTINGGNSWEAVISAPSPHQLYDICVPKFSKKMVYAVGGLLNFNFSGFQDVRNIVLKSTNYGTSWDTTINANGIGASQLEYCYFLNDSIGFVAGSCGPYISNNSRKKTTDAGQSWSAMDGVITLIYGGSNVDFLTTHIGYLGNFYRTTNQGNNWIQTNFINNVYSKISFVNEQVGYIGADGIHRTTNGGINWTAIDTVFDGLDMVFADSLRGYVVGDNGIIYKAIDGLDFIQQSSPTSNTLTQIFPLNRDTVFVIGNNGTILKTTNGGMLSSANELPQTVNEFRLEQNYPNPFNPSTAIKFSLLQASQTSLIIYDLLGRQMVELVNEKRLAGNYEVKFDASRLASGIYFYRLVTSSFSQTRKMILVK